MDFRWEVTLAETYVSGRGSTPSSALSNLEENLAAQIERDKENVLKATAGLRHLENVRAELGLPMRTTEFR